MPSYIKDTRHVINILSNYESRAGAWLVTADATSLYTAIPHDLGLILGSKIKSPQVPKSVHNRPFEICSNT